MQGLTDLSDADVSFKASSSSKKRISRHSEMPKARRSMMMPSSKRNSNVTNVIIGGKSQLKERFSINLEKKPSFEEAQRRCDYQNDLKAVRKLIFGSWLNVLFVFIPIGFVANFAGWSDSLIFFTNFLGMIPLANLLGDSTESLAEHLGETIGGLLNATFGNAVEVVVMVMALVRAKNAEHEERETLMTVVQCSLIGSIFSNSLLVLGCSFLANGINHHEGEFSEMAATENVSLLLLAAFVMILPGPYAEHAGEGTHDSLMVSRAAAIVLLTLYLCLLLFVMGTHADRFTVDQASPSLSIGWSRKESVSLQHAEVAEHQVDHKDPNPPHNSLRQTLLDEDFEDHDDRSIEGRNGSDDESLDELDLSLYGSMTVLLISTIVVAIMSEYLVGSIDGMAQKLELSPAFVGIILLPIIGNAVEHMTAVRMAYADKMDVAIAIAIGSATQVAMLVVGLAVVVAWILDLDLDLAFNTFEVNIFLYSTIIIFTLVADGKSNWLEGVMLIGLYVLIAVAVYPQDYGR